MSRRPPKAPTGRPPPMILPKVVRSGRTPKRSWAPPHAVRNEMTSSKISRMPCRSVTSRSRGRKPSTGGISPALHMNGIDDDGGDDAASLLRGSPRRPRRRSTAARRRASATAGGHPRRPRDRLGPPPAARTPSRRRVTLTITQSCVPWKAPSNFAIFGRPVKARARRTAFIVASVPELVKRTLSHRGHAAARASRPAGSRARSGPGTTAPTRPPRCTAFTTSGGGVAEDQARVVAVEVHALDAVGVPDVGALPALEVERDRDRRRSSCGCCRPA